MPKLLKFLAINLAFGIAVGLICVALLLATNTAGLRTLIWESSNPALALLLLSVGMCVTFGSAVMGSAVMLMPYEGDDSD
jgi:hypothetical protein